MPKVRLDLVDKTIQLVGVSKPESISIKAVSAALVNRALWVRFENAAWKYVVNFYPDERGYRSFLTMQTVEPEGERLMLSGKCVQ